MTSIEAEAIQIFEENRPRLLGLAYRILGSVSEAEDAVQDTCIKWLAVDRKDIKTPGAWLTTVCTRRSIDLLKAAHKQRVDYVGTWLPEPARTETGSDVEQELELADSVTNAFLLMLERLSPKERAAYLLYEVFGQPYDAISDTLGIAEAACRKLVSRARSHVVQPAVRQKPSREIQDRLLTAFQKAVKSGETGHLGALLSEDIKLAADGGGKISAAQKIVGGKHRILRFIARALHAAWVGSEPELAELNGRLSLIYRGSSPEVTTISFDYGVNGSVSHIYIMRNPDKLGHLVNELVLM